MLKKNWCAKEIDVPDIVPTTAVPVIITYLDITTTIFYALLSYPPMLYRYSGLKVAVSP